jgi:glutathione S-transferase
MLLYSSPLSWFARKVEIALHEKGLVFERVMVPYSQDTGYTPKHPVVLEHNPKGQVPVLIDNDLALIDSTLIFEYLEDAYPSPPLYPTGARPRAICRMLELFADEIMLPPLRVLMRRPEAVRASPADEAAAETALRAHYDRLEQRLGDDGYFCGDISVADIAIFMSILYTQRLRGPNLDAHPRLAAWYGRAGARPAFARIANEVAAADLQLSPRLNQL